MTDYKIKKNRFLVKVYFLDGTIEEGDLYLSLNAAHHDGPETVSDVLSEDGQFIPINFREEGIMLINKANIMLLSFPLFPERIEEFVSSGEKEVLVRLVNKTQRDGKFIFQLPDHQTRVKDFLNRAALFVELRNDREIWLINKNHILSVTEK